MEIHHEVIDNLEQGEECDYQRYIGSDTGDGVGSWSSKGETLVPGDDGTSHKGGGYLSHTIQTENQEGIKECSFSREDCLGCLGQVEEYTACYKSDDEG